MLFSSLTDPSGTIVHTNRNNSSLCASGPSALWGKKQRGSFLLYWEGVFWSLVTKDKPSLRSTEPAPWVCLFNKTSPDGGMQQSSHYLTYSSVSQSTQAAGQIYMTASWAAADERLVPIYTAALHTAKINPSLLALSARVIYCCSQEGAFCFFWEVLFCTAMLLCPKCCFCLILSLFFRFNSPQQKTNQFMLHKWSSDLCVLELLTASTVISLQNQ